jgi:hypothetical protein
MYSPILILGETDVEVTYLERSRHGDLSATEHTAEGKAKASRLKHGRFSQAAIQRRREARAIIRGMRELLREMASHGR